MRPLFTACFLFFAATAAVFSQVNDVHSSRPVFGHYRTVEDSLEAARLIGKGLAVFSTDLDSAVSCFEAALRTVRKSITGDIHHDLITCLSSLGSLLSRRARYDEANRYYGQTIDVLRAFFPNGHTNIASLINNIGVNQYRLGNYTKAESLYTKALEMHREILGNNSEEVANDLQNLAVVSESLGDYEQSERHYKEAIAIYQGLSEPDTLALARVLGNLATFYANNSRFVKAATAYREAEHMYRLLPNPESQYYSSLLFNIAVFHEKQGRDSLAEYYYSSALAVGRRVYPRTHPALVSLVHSLAYFYATRERYLDAEPLYREALNLYREIYPQDHPELARILNNAASFYRNAGRFDAAEPLFIEALNMYKRILPPDHPTLSIALNNMAEFYHARGLDAEAEPLFKEAIAILRRNPKKRNRDLARNLNNLAVYYVDRGRYEDAKPLYEESLGLLREVHASDHAEIATMINNLGGVDDRTGQYASAESLWTASLEMLRRIRFTRSSIYAQVLNNLGSLYFRRGKLNQAGKYLTESLEVYSLLHSGDHPKTAIILNNLAKLNDKLGKAATADSLYRLALEMRRRLFTTGHRSIMNSDRFYGSFLARQNRFNEALALYQELLEGVETGMRQSFSFDNEQHQLAYVSNIIKPNLDHIGEFCLRFLDRQPTTAVLFLDALLRFKGAIIKESTRRSAEKSKNAHAVKLNEQLTNLRGQEAILASRPATENLRKIRRRILIQADSIETALRFLDREYDKLRRRQNADWRQVQRQLRPSEALVEFAVISVFKNFTEELDSTLFAAVVLRRTGKPTLVKLCRENAISPYFAADVTSNRAYSYITEPARSHELYAKIWKPLEPFLDNTTTVLLSPDGLLHQLAFGALVTSIANSGPVFLDDRITIQYIAGGRSLLNRDFRFRPTPYRRPRNVVLIGNPDFSLGMKKKTSGWKPLPGTAEEVEGIAALCSEHGVTVDVVTGNNASEELVKSLSGNAPRVLHLATHGFFFPAPLPSAGLKEMSSMRRRGGSKLRTEKNSLLRSGLVFAGVNSAWTGRTPQKGKDDGILSALEVSRIDLTGTELVVLSACETGLGDIHNGEGIFGLQRAFQVAGAQTILMSLWKVADKPTAELMNLFYSSWLTGKSRTEAFRNARARIRAKYPSPYIWAAFVMIGE